MSEPALYGQGNVKNPHMTHTVGFCLSDETATRALAAYGGFLKFSFLKKELGSSTQVANVELTKTYLDAASQLFEGIRLLNKKLGNTKDALSSGSIMAAATLGACTVSDLICLRRSRSANILETA